MYLFPRAWYLHSEPAARVDGLASIEVKPARTLAETLQFLRPWRQQIITVVMDLKGSPESLWLLSSLRTLISSLASNDTRFAKYIRTQTRRFYGIRNDQTFMETVNLLEIEMASRAHEDDEEKRKQKNTSLAMAVFTQKGSGKDKQKSVCRDCVTEDGCKRGGHAVFLPASCHSWQMPSLWLH